jgi:hypothetical protein
MNRIRQDIVIEDWPLSKTGDKKFFGYLVAVGAFPFDWDGEEDSWIPYADFAYNKEYTRYKLPQNEFLEDLLKQLFNTLECNTVLKYNHKQKVWIDQYDTGYLVQEP